jgi:hypothetical protein
MLKGLGACIALPFLQAMTPPGKSFYNMTRKPLRFACLFMPNGVNEHTWTPEQYGMNFKLSRALQPLETLKDKIIIMDQMMNKDSIFKGADGHYAKAASILTCSPIFPTTGDDMRSEGISFDQLIAQQKGQETLFDSLQYGIDRIDSGINANVGYTRMYGSIISWKTPTQPCTREIEPRMAFDRLFRKYLPNAKQNNEAWRQSVLDLVKNDADDLQRKLGRSDQDKLEEYLESIRSIEKRMEDEEKLDAYERQITPEIQKELIALNKRIVLSGKNTDAEKDLSTFDFAVEGNVAMRAGSDVTEKTRQMLDIMALAFWSDATRVGTYMFGNELSNRNFSFIEGVHGGHHQISHHGNNADSLEQYARINEWHVTQYAYFLQRLRELKEGDESLLDNSMIMLCSGLRDGNTHSPYNLPIVLGGKAGGRLKTGQNLHLKKDTPLSNLYLSMAGMLDMPLKSFADSTGELYDIHA